GVSRLRLGTDANPQAAISPLTIFDLALSRIHAIVRPLTEPDQLIDWDEPVPVVRARLRLYVRGCLIAIALGLALVFGIAAFLDPYRDGRVWTDETHTQLGLPPCTFKVVTGVPCPSCGMTTSFALLVRGDIYNSLRANFAGTALAVMCLLYIPWA